MNKKTIIIALCFFALSLPSTAQTIWMSAIKGKVNDVEAALSKGTDINAKGNSGYTLLFFAVAGNQYKMVEYLLGKGAESAITNNEGNSPLIYAISQDNKKMVKLLIEKAADVNLPGKGGVFPIEYAMTYGRDYDIIEMLYNAGASIDIKDSNGRDYKSMIMLRKDKKKIEKLFSTAPTGVGK